MNCVTLHSLQSITARRRDRLVSSRKILFILLLNFLLLLYLQNYKEKTTLKYVTVLYLSKINNFNITL